MIFLRQGPFSAAEWGELTQSWPMLTLTQSWAHGAARAGAGWSVEHATLYDGEVAVGALQAMIRPLPMGLGGLVWISRGPIADPEHVPDAETYAALLAAVRDHYADRRGYYLRIAPAWPSIDSFGACAAKAGFVPAGPLGWHSATLDLSVDLDALRKGLSGKWRGHLNKAETLGYALTSGDDEALFDAFCAAHDAFIAAAGFETTVTGPVLRQMRDTASPDLQMTVFRADLNGETAGWLLTARTGQRVEYLAGHTTPAGRRGGGQILLWQALLAAKAAGAAIFDVGGMDPNLTTPGIYTYKAGTGAEPYALAPEIEALPNGLVRKIPALMVRMAARRARAGG